jgi:predicted RNA binding protein YcfA (HicA-like mRNA interferase family)
MNYKQLTKRLRELGCEFDRQSAGSHEVWWNPSTQKLAIIPRHGGGDIPMGTLRAIVRQLGILPDDFYKRQG